MNSNEGGKLMYRKKSSGNVKPNCVVGIGASAGGLEALQQFLTFLPSNTGMAFVIIQHLAPNHKSLVADILAKYSTMPVTEIKEGMAVERNHIYMIPPKYNVEIEQDKLHLAGYDPKKINHPIDVFFRSLAVAYQNRAIAVILSGAGSDGTNGIRSVKEQNGVIIVQSPESAKFDGMPRNAIATGLADLVQNPDAIAKEMEHIAASIVDTSAHFLPSDQDLLSQVFAILKNVTNINYAYYKQTTILRRIERRLVVTHTRNLREYVAYLNRNPEEAKVLAKEVLIGVTSFFRDPDYFEILKEQVIRKLVERTPRDQQIRVWVAGCSTGEEAYSIAIVFAEVMEELNLRRDVKIFATDLDTDSVEIAVRGTYGDNILEDVSVARLTKYFNRKGNKYVIHHDIRKMIIFAQHNVFQDPPFGKLDLISCRNVLIYFQTVLQRNLFAIFHMALNDQGYLFLGRSESVVDYDDVFRTLCVTEKIFIHHASGKVPEHEYINYTMQNITSNMEPVRFQRAEEDQGANYKPSELNTAVLETLMPACVLVDEDNNLIRSYGDLGDFLSIPAGAATLDIFMLLRNDLKIPVSTVLQNARTSGERAGYDKVPVKIGDTKETITIVADPIFERSGHQTDYIAVSFLRGAGAEPQGLETYSIDTAASRRIADLEQELRNAKDNLRKTVTELESVNAELQAANEELLTESEELQSSNEELQSVNEELYTVNSEYQSKVTELAAVNDDMANFLSTTLVGVLMVDKNLNIRKFTEYISSEFNILEQDVGRSLRYVSYNFATIDLLQLCKEVLETLEPVEQLCASEAGKTYLIRIAPYRGLNSAGHDVRNEIQGLVLTFVDTTKQVDDQEQIDMMAEALREAVRSGREKETFLSHMSHDLRTPMTAIFGLTELSLREDGITENVRDNLEKIHSASNYMLELVEEILETSRINSGKVVTLSSAVREEQVLEAVRAIVEEQAKTAKVRFSVGIRGSENRYVLMDEQHVERILLNLLTNSVKFTPEGGKVSLEVHVSYKDGKSHHKYVVRDTGVGISEDFQQRMFLPFEQDNADSSGREGTGLGLYICKNLVDLLGGTIRFNSSVGEGTVFVVELQYELATEEQVLLQQKRNVTYEDRLLYGKNVLLAEDNRVNAEVVMKFLHMKGIRAELARDGQEAVELFRAHGAYYYQAILMDLMMPIMNGLSAAKMIRASAQEDAQLIPIIALTADVTGDVEERIRNAGMQSIVTKPVDSALLFSCLAEEFKNNVKKSLKQQADEVEDAENGGTD